MVHAIFVHNKAGDSLRGSWMFNVKNITLTSFFTYTRLFNSKDSNYYSFKVAENTGYIVTPMYGFDCYDICPDEEAQILQVPYHFGHLQHSMDEVSHIEDNKFLLFEKSPLERVPNSLTGEMRPRYNSILERLTIEHYPCCNVQYKYEDATSLIEQRGNYICLKKIDLVI